MLEYVHHPKEIRFARRKSPILKYLHSVPDCQIDYLEMRELERCFDFLCSILLEYQRVIHNVNQ